MPSKLPDSMHWQIYQAFLSGPHTLFHLFEEAFGREALHGPPDPDHQQRQIDDLSAHISRLEAQVEKLRAEVSQLRGRNFQLGRRNAELEVLVVKDSHNSSRPPSTDPPWIKRTRSLRRPSGRQPGGQVGHPGHTLRLTQHPTRVLTHRPSQCRHCSSPLREGRSTGAERQVIDLMPVRLRVTEHRAEVVRCPRCGQRTKASFPEGVRAAVQYGPSVVARALYLHDYQLLPYARTVEAMRELFGCAVSAGTLSAAVRQCAAGLIKTELKIKRQLRRSSVIHADETGLRGAGQLHYVHVASTARLTHYGADARRGTAAIDEIGVLPEYRGTCVHDGWLSYTFYPKCRHSLCGAHLLRELTYFEELSPETKAWAEPLKEFYERAVKNKALPCQPPLPAAWRLAPVAVCPERVPTLLHCTLRHRPSFTSLSRPIKPSRVIHAGMSTMVLSETSGSSRLRPTAISGHPRGHTVTGGPWRLVHVVLSDTIQLDTLPRTFVVSRR